jgi:hypothetical protein
MLQKAGPITSMSKQLPHAQQLQIREGKENTF